MTQVKITQRFGQHEPGSTIDVDQTTADWIVGIGKGVTSDNQGYQQRAVAPGTHGPDPLAGGDPTRLYGLTSPGVEHPHAGQVPGSPVQYNAGVRESESGAQSGRPEAKRAAADAARASDPRTRASSPTSGSPSGDTSNEQRADTRKASTRKNSKD